MEKPLSKLKILPANKTVVFWSPLDSDEVLVRTGTIGDGSCMFHSLLYAYSKEYTSMDTSGRMQFVRRLRASMAGKIDRENWEQIGGGLIAKIPFQEKVNYILTNLYLFLAEDNRARGRSTRHVIKNLTNEDAQELDTYQVITELIPLEEGFEQQILPKAYANSDDKIADCCKAIITETLHFLNNTEEIKSIEPKVAEYIREMTRKMMDAIIKEAEDSAFKEYVKGLENVAESIDTYTIELISDRFNRDIYFLDSKTRMPYNICQTVDSLKKRKSIIVLWIGGNHYEVVGRLLPGNRVQREFTHDDPLIQKMYTFLVKPETVAEKYPELNPYLPREYRDHNPQSPNRSPSRSPNSYRASSPEYDYDQNYRYDSSDNDSSDSE